MSIPAMNDTIIAEKIAWGAYRLYVRQRTSPHLGGSATWQGDAQSHVMWLVWKQRHEARRDAAHPFYRRSNGIRFGR